MNSAVYAWVVDAKYKVAIMWRKYFFRLLILTMAFIVVSEIFQHFNVSASPIIEKSAQRGSLFNDSSHQVEYDLSISNKYQFNKTEPEQLLEDTTVIKDPTRQRKVPVRSTEQQDVATPRTFRQINNGSFVYSAYYDDRSNISSVVRIFGVADNASRDDPPTCTLRFNDNSYQVTKSWIIRLEPRKYLG